MIAVVLMTTLFGAAGVASADPSADDWYRLRVCESGNNYAINTGNGYYGAYQFDLGTWRSVGGTGYPNDASPATQDALALKLWQSRGWSPWACARIVGLRDSPVSAPAAPPPPPAGFVDSISVNGLSGVAAGWAYDPSQASTSTQVHIYVNYQLQRGLANQSRADVNSAFGISGQHGYSIPISLQPGGNQVCIFAIGVDPNTHTDLGCRIVMASYPPGGNLDSVTASGSTMTLNGWAYDPNQPGASTPVYFYVNDQFYAGPANGPRDDVNSVMGIGGQHGFSLSAPLRPGPNVVCVYAIGVDPNAHTLLGCPTV